MADAFWEQALKSRGGQGSAAIRLSERGAAFWGQALGESRGGAFRGRGLSKRGAAFWEQALSERGAGVGRGGSSALRRAEETGDKGLIAAAKRIADKVGLDDAANVVMRGLQIMDYPRAAVLSGLIELTDLIPGIEHIEGTDRIQQTGVSWDDFVTNVKRQIGFGDVLEADPDYQGLNIWAKRGIGFLGDVAFDPLTYTGIGAVAKGAGALGDVARGARAAENVADATRAGARRGLRRRPEQAVLLRDQDVAERLIRAGNREAAEAIMQARSTAAVPREVLQSVGADRGLYFMGRRVPGLTRVADAISLARGRARRAISEVFHSERLVSPRAWALFEQVPGTAMIRHSKHWRSRGEAHARALEWTMMFRDSAAAAKEFQGTFRERLSDLARRFGQVDRDQLRRGIEAGDTSIPGVEEFHQLAEDLRLTVNELAGVEIPRLENYLSHILNPEVRDALGKAPSYRQGRATFSPALKRKLEGTIDELNEEFREFLLEADEQLIAKLGGRRDVNLFLDDPFEIMSIYIDQAARFIRFKMFERMAIDAGFINFINMPAIRKAIKHNKRVFKKVAKLSGKAERLEKRAEESRAKAEEIEREIREQPFQRTRLRSEAVQKEIQAESFAEEAHDLGRLADEITAELEKAVGRRRELIEQRKQALPESKHPRRVLEAARERQQQLQATQGELARQLESAEEEVRRLEELAAQPDPTPPVEIDKQIAAREAERQQLRKELNTLRQQRKRAVQKATAKPKPVPLSPFGRRQQAIRKLREVGAPGRVIRDFAQRLSADPDDPILKQVEERYGLPTALDPAETDPETLAMYTGLDEEKARRLVEQAQKAGSGPAPDTSAIDQQIAEKSAQQKNLTQAIQELRQQRKAAVEPAVKKPENLSEQIARARRRVNAAKGRLTKQEKAIERNLKVIEENAALLETGFVMKGDVQFLIDQNNERIQSLRDLLRSTKKEKRATLRQELRLRNEAKRLFQLAEQETDPRLRQHARFQAQAKIAEAQAGLYREKARGWAFSYRHVSQRELELVAAAAKDQLRQITQDGRLWADPDTADALVRLREMLTPSKIGTLLRWHDTLMSRWKAWALLSPGYHWRNAYSALFMNQVAGYSGGLGGYLRFYKLYRRAAKGDLEGALKSIKDPAYRRAFESMWNRRHMLFDQADGPELSEILGPGTQEQGIFRDRLRNIRGKNVNLDPTALDFAPLAANRRVASAVERTVRGPLYIDGILKGLSEQEAYARVVRFHFDYLEGISKFEKEVMRRVIPFYTWMRLNFPLQMEMMFRNPGVYMKYWHAKRNLEFGTEDEEVVPSFLGELGSIALPIHDPISGQEGERSRMYVAPDLPFLRLGQTFDLDQLLSQTSPLIKTPLELNRGVQFYSDLPFGNYPKQMPSYMAPLGPLFELADGKLGLPRVFRGDDGNYYFESERERYKVEQAMPLLARLRRLFPNDESGQDRALSSWLSFGLGATTLSNTQRRQEIELMRRDDEIDRLVDAYKRRMRAMGQE